MCLEGFGASGLKGGCCRARSGAGGWLVCWLAARAVCFRRLFHARGSLPSSRRGRLDEGDSTRAAPSQPRVSDESDSHAHWGWMHCRCSARRRRVWRSKTTCTRPISTGSTGPSRSIRSLLMLTSARTRPSWLLPTGAAKATARSGRQASGVAADHRNCCARTHGARRGSLDARLPHVHGVTAGLQRG